jgi:hypothetical protein
MSECGLAAKDVDEKEDDNHQDSDPNRYFLKRADASHTPVQRIFPAPGKARVAISASARLKWADSATLRAGLGIEPLRHQQEIASIGKNFQWYERGRHFLFVQGQSESFVERGPINGRIRAISAGGRPTSGGMAILRHQTFQRHNTHIYTIHLVGTLGAEP